MNHKVFNRATEQLKRLTVFRLGLLLVFAIILGGTSQDIISVKTPLYLVSTFFIAQCLIFSSGVNRQDSLKFPILFLFLFIVLNILYLLPLPPSLWTSLPGRELIVDSYKILKLPLPWLPLSMTPEVTLFSLYDFLPPIAVLCIVAKGASNAEIEWAVTFVLIAVMVSVILGATQVISTNKSLYFYDVTNRLSAVGFFSNTNHLATLCLLALPLALGRLYLRLKYNTDGRSLGPVETLAPIVLLFGIILSGSLLGYILALITLPMTLFLGTKLGVRARKPLLALSVVIVIGLILDVFFLGNNFINIFSRDTSASLGSRIEYNQTTISMIKDYLPFGSGLGSFDDLHRLYGQVGQRFLNHAHNDFAEVILEFGIFGLIGIMTCLGWMLMTARKLLTSPSDSPFLGRCAYIGLFAVLFHSLLDYPLRTMAISSMAVFLICLIHLHLDFHKTKISN